MSSSTNPLAAGVPSLSPPKSTQTMLGPDGSVADIPVENVQSAIQGGYKVAMDMTSPDGSTATIPADRAHDAITQGGYKPTGITQGESTFYQKHPANVLYRDIRQHETSDQIAARQRTAKNASQDIETTGQVLSAAGGLALAPVPTIVSLASGAASQIAGEKTAAALGASPENAERVGNVTGLVGGLVGGVGGSALEEPVADSYDSAKSSLQDAYAKVKSAFADPDEPVPSPQTPKPNFAHVEIDTPFDDATIRKTVDKDLTPEARQTLRNATGPTIEAGSSPNNQLVKAVAPINNTITTEGLKLNQLVETAPPMSSSYGTGNYINDIADLKEELPASVQDQYGKDIDKEIARYGKAINSNDPQEVLAAKRDLDQRIKSFTAPEEPIDSPAKAADAARVTLRRGFSNLLSTEIPETKPINDVLSKNLEVRSALDNKLGDIARDPVAADAQYRSELAKGKTIVQNKLTDAANQAQYAADVARVKANRLKALVGAGTVGLVGFHNQIAKVLALLP